MFTTTSFFEDELQDNSGLCALYTMAFSFHLHFELMFLPKPNINTFFLPKLEKQSSYQSLTSLSCKGLIPLFCSLCNCSGINQEGVFFHETQSCKGLVINYLTSSHVQYVSPVDRPHLCLAHSHIITQTLRSAWFLVSGLTG